MLALTFSNSSDYELVREGDRLSIESLDEMAPGRPVVCRIRHSDGTTHAVELRHTYSAGQLEWFRAGSALNCMSRAQAA